MNIYTFSESSRQVYVQRVPRHGPRFSLEGRGDPFGQRDPDDVRVNETVEGMFHERGQGALLVHRVQPGHQFGLVQRRSHVPLDPHYRQQITQNAKSCK